jgi:hypothetical protein
LADDAARQSVTLGALGLVLAPALEHGRDLGLAPLAIRRYQSLE